MYVLIMGVMEKKMESTILFRGYGFYADFLV